MRAIFLFTLVAFLGCSQPQLTEVSERATNVID
ncbi:MAG: hypothetical protein ACI9EQ_002493, partial [Bacteroidia bacterium]